MNITQRRAAALALLLEPIVFKDDWTLEQKAEHIRQRRAQVNLTYYFMDIHERRKADAWIKAQPRTSDPEFNPKPPDEEIEVTHRKVTEATSYDLVKRRMYRRHRDPDKNPT